MTPKEPSSESSDSALISLNLDAGVDLPPNIGPYRILRWLGRGGMGELFLARDERLERTVAVKRIRPDRSAPNPERRERLRREAKLAARLNHPSIVQIYDFVEEVDGDSVVMEFVEGTDLRRLVDAEPLTWRRAAALGEQVARGLAEAHRKGVIHRDLKTENILVAESGDAKITDFGIAKSVRREPGSDESLTAEGGVMGTCRSMSPEQAKGEDLDARSDLFSLGTLLYESLTGSSPFLAGSYLATLNRIVYETQKPAAEIRLGIPLAFSELIDRLLQKEPGGRPKDADEVADALQGLISSDTSGLNATFSGGPTESIEVFSERRQVTVLSCQLTSSNDRPGGLDVEDLLALKMPFFDRATEILRRLDGSVGTHLDDGLVAYFGYPSAREDDARRALDAALALVNSTAAIGPGAALKVGVHTGQAVAAPGADGKRQLTLGKTGLVAGAIKDMVPAQGTLISEATRNLVEGFFQCDLYDEYSLPGYEGPQRVYLAVAASGAYSKVESLAAVELTPFIARERELELIRDRWRLARRGQGQAVLLSGEAGIGKSRLLRHINDHLREDDTRWWQCNCSPDASHTPFYPIAKLLRRQLPTLATGEALQALETGNADFGHLESVISGLDMPVTETVPLLAAFFSLPLSEGYAELPLGPEGRRRKTLEILVSLVLEQAEERPLFLVVEDLHWADPSTLEFIGLLLSNVPATSLFLLLSFRPGFTPPWSQPSYVTPCALSPLSEEQTSQMLEQLVREGSLPNDVLERIVRETDGVPLFVEELTKMMLESTPLSVEGAVGRSTAGSATGTGEALRLPAVPSSLRSSLLARLDHLGDARLVAQAASVVGRDFRHELLEMVVGTGIDIAAGLDRLVDAELLYRRGFRRKARYQFKHALIRDVAYESLLDDRRRQYHRRAAEGLTWLAPETEQARPELLAYHYTEARIPEKAMRYWQAAGGLAARRFANHEAVSHLRLALTMLEKMPKALERDRRELAIWSALGLLLSSTQGYSGPEIESAYTRASELARKLDHPVEAFWAQAGLSLFYVVQGRFAQGLELQQQNFELAEAAGDPKLRCGARMMLATTLFNLCELDDAHRWFAESVSLAAEKQGAPFILRTGVDPLSVARAYDALILWFNGFPDQALAESEKAVAAAAQASHPYSQALTAHFRAWLFQLAGDFEACGEWTQRSAAICQEQSFSLVLVMNGILGGWLRSLMPDGEAGVEQMRQAIEGLRSMGARCYHTYYFSLLAEAHARRGQLEEAKAALQAAFREAAETGETFWLPELHRLAAQQAQECGAIDDAEAQLTQSLQLARQQKTRLLELRAATQLAGLQMQRGGAGDGGAIQLVKSIYDRFDEGFETRDMVMVLELLRKASTAPQ